MLQFISLDRCLALAPLSRAGTVLATSADVRAINALVLAISAKIEQSVARTKHRRVKTIDVKCEVYVAPCAIVFCWQLGDTGCNVGFLLQHDRQPNEKHNTSQTCNENVELSSKYD